MNIIYYTFSIITIREALMNPSNKIRVGLVGLGFGAEFIPIYLYHPVVASLTICDPNPVVLKAAGDKFGVARRCLELSELLRSDEIDAVHLVTPIPLHARHSIAVLEAGKHCACTVPMATSIADLRAVVAAQRRSGKNFMGMETAVYTRRFLYVRDLLAQGEFGRIQFLKGAHYQDMEGWPAYWLGLPPMHYATHAVSPVLALAGTRAKTVHCFGSGTMRAELRQVYGNPYPVETAVFELEGAPLAAEVSRSLFETARGYTESFHVYGEKISFEWEQVEGEPPVLFKMTGASGQAAGRGSTISAERIEAPDRPDLLPPEIARFTRKGYYDEVNPHLSFLQGGGHGGSHPHLVHEFISSIVEGRRPAIDALRFADWSAPGICAHESAMKGGARVDIPTFD
jgi:predicted dehydrogenase